MTRLLTAADLAEALGISAYTVLAHARTGRLPHVRIGNRVRFDPDILTRLIEQGYNSHHVPSTAEVEKAPKRDNRADVVGRVVGVGPRTRRKRQARSQEREPRTMRECVAEICKGLACGEAVNLTLLDGLDLPPFRAGSVVATTGGAVEPQHQIGDERHD